MNHKALKSYNRHLTLSTVERIGQQIHLLKRHFKPGTGIHISHFTIQEFDHRCKTTCLFQFQVSEIGITPVHISSLPQNDLLLFPPSLFWEESETLS